MRRVLIEEDPQPEVRQPCGDYPELDPIVIAESGHSEYTIVIPDGADIDIMEAANELQIVVEQATGAKLVILHEKEAETLLSGPYISIGPTSFAQAEGLDGSSLPHSAARIIKKEQNLFIIGKDAPDDPIYHSSTGSANGTYVFLENCLDARWLLPGDIGRDVPKIETFTLGSMDLTINPQIKTRSLTRISNLSGSSEHRDNIQNWARHMRIVEDGSVPGSHNFLVAVNRAWDPVSKTMSGIDYNVEDTDCALYQQAYNPRYDAEGVLYLYGKKQEWFPLIDGERPPPGPNSRKFETTNQDLVKWYAGQAARSMECSGRIWYSATPSDSSGFSQSEDSKAYIGQQPDYIAYSNRGLTSYTPLILKWYSDVIRELRARNKNAYVAGMLYGHYAVPSADWDGTLPDHFIPQFVPSTDSHYGLLIGEYEAQSTAMFEDWARGLKKGQHATYYGYPAHWWQMDTAWVGSGEQYASGFGGMGMLAPSHPKIWDHVSRRLALLSITGAEIYGDQTFGNFGGLRNYLAAKMFWNPQMDTYAVYTEWLERMYGKEAAKAIANFDDYMAQLYKEYQEQRDDKKRLRIVRYPTVEFLEEVYAANHREMEAILQIALDAPKTTIQEERLSFIINYMKLFLWRLQNGGLIQESAISKPFFITDAQLETMVKEESENFALFPGFQPSKSSSTIRFYKAKIVESPINQGPVPPISTNSILLMTRGSQPVKVTFDNVVNNMFFASYGIREIQTYDRPLIESGIIWQNRTLNFSSVDEAAYYRMTMRYYKPNTFKATIHNAVLGNGSYSESDKELTVSAAPTAKIIIYRNPEQKYLDVYEDGLGNVVIERKLEP